MYSLRNLNQSFWVVEFHQRQFAVLFRYCSTCLWRSLNSFTMTSRCLDIFPSKSQRKTQSWKSLQENRCWDFLCELSTWEISCEENTRPLNKIKTRAIRRDDKLVCWKEGEGTLTFFPLAVLFAVPHYPNAWNRQGLRRQSGNSAIMVIRLPMGYSPRWSNVLHVVVCRKRNLSDNFLNINAWLVKKSFGQ